MEMLFIQLMAIKFVKETVLTVQLYIVSTELRCGVAMEEVLSILLMETKSAMISEVFCLRLIDTLL